MGKGNLAADFEAIVIGSGVGGLSAALKIARSSRSVLLLEGRSEYGGCLNPIQIEGYSFDVGLHYVGKMGEGEQLWEVLRDLDLLDKAKFIELDPEAIDRYLFPDFELRLCKGKERFKEQLITLFPKEERGIAKYFHLYDLVTRAAKSAYTMEPRLTKFLGWLVKNPAMLKYGRVPYQDLLDSVTSDRRLQAALSAPWFDYMLPPATASVTYGIGTWDHYLEGAYYPRGGNGGFRDVFVKALQGAGATLKHSSLVTEIDRQGEVFCVRAASGENWTAKVVVSNVDPVLTLGSMVNQELVPSRVKKKAARLRPSASVFGTLLGTDLDLPSLGITNGNLVPYTGYDINEIFRETMAQESPGKTDCLFINSPSVKDHEGGLAPQGRHSLQILGGASFAAFEQWAGQPEGARGEEYENLNRQIGDRMVSAAECYIPRLSQHITHVSYYTPLSLRDRAGLVRGGIYGLELSPDQMGPGRFPGGSCGVDGLFLAGAGVLGGSVGISMISGLQAGSKAIGYLGV